MKPFKKSVTGKKLEGKLTKKVTKSDVGEGLQSTTVMRHFVGDVYFG